MKHHGSCMCGKLTFSFGGEPRFVAECVCESCRKAHGATAVAWVGVATEQFQLDAGNEVLKWYQSSDASQRGFCTECGTRLFFRSSKWPGETHMTVANLQEPHNLKSSLISFSQEKPHWTRLEFEH